MSDPGASHHDDADIAIRVSDLHRSFRKRSGWLRSGELVEAVRGIDFAVPRGTVFGVLGPNGAGKTTTIKMLATLLLPTGGSATIHGFDVVRDEQEVRRRLGVLFGGDKGLYNQLSGFENMRYFGRLYGMDDRDIRRRTDELLETVQLLDRADERVESYSRGMKQRLHIAKTLIHDPPVIILDEPTIGLDPGAANDVRALIAALVPNHTVLLTTHDMAEADLLCREIAIVDQGRIVAAGAPVALKAGTDIDRRIVVTLAPGSSAPTRDLTRLLGALPDVLRVEQGQDATGFHQLELVCTQATSTLDATLAALRERGIGVATVEIREPSLEDVFLRATGRSFEPDDADDANEGSP